MGTITGISGVVWKISSLLALPLAVYLGNRVGKKQVFFAALLLGGGASLGNWFLLTPKYPYLQLVFNFFIGPAMMCILLFMNSMIADICDLDEAEHGIRREAMFAAVNTWFTKIGISVSVAFSGIMVMATGFTLEDGCNQSIDTILRMRLLYILLPAIGMFVGAALMWGYPLSESVLNKAKKELKCRHESATGEETK